jgi:hypothetical protein
MPAPPLACPVGGTAAAAERALVARAPVVLVLLPRRAAELVERAAVVRPPVLPVGLPTAAGRVLEAGGMEVDAGSRGGGTAGAGVGVESGVEGGDEGGVTGEVASAELTTVSPAAAVALTLAALEVERGVRLAMAGREKGTGKGWEGSPPLPGASRQVPRNR